MRVPWIGVISATVAIVAGCRESDSTQTATTTPAKAPTPAAPAAPKPLDIKGRVAKQKVMGSEIELKFTNVNVMGMTNFEDGIRTRTLDLIGMLNIPAESPVIGVSLLEATEVTDDKGNNLLPPKPSLPVPSGKGTPPPQPPRGYSQLQRPAPGQKSIQQGVSLHLGQLSDLPRTIKRVKGTVYLLMKGRSSSKELPAKASDGFVDIGGGYSIQLSKVEEKSNTVTVFAKLRRPAEDQMNYQGHRFKFVALDDKGQPLPGGMNELSLAKESEARGFFSLTPGRSIKKLQVTVNTEMKEESIPFDLDRVPVL